MFRGILVASSIVVSSFGLAEEAVTFPVITQVAVEAKSEGIENADYEISIVGNVNAGLSLCEEKNSIIVFSSISHKGTTVYIPAVGSKETAEPCSEEELATEGQGIAFAQTFVVKSKDINQTFLSNVDQKGTFVSFAYLLSKSQVAE